MFIFNIVLGKKHYGTQYHYAVLISVTLNTNTQEDSKQGTPYCRTINTLRFGGDHAVPRVSLERKNH